MSLPPDNHVHSEWSWDAWFGSMERTCEQALRLGLPSIAFTEHLDHTVWTPSPEGLAGLPPDHPVAVFSDEAGRVTPPAFEVEGYLAALERCQATFADLRIFSGLEIGEPHWHPEAVNAVLQSATFDRLLGSLHSLPDGDGFQEPGDLYVHRAPDEVMREYLGEVARLVAACDTFSILAHIDYPVRYWPEASSPFDPALFEDEFRHALRATAASGRVLEISTVLPLQPIVLRWWREEGGDAVTFGSDAHEPSELARNLAEAAAIAEAVGFRPSADPLDPWSRC